MNFQEKLRSGQLGESKIANWLKSKGWNILPVYEIEINSGKGQRLFTPEKQLIAPDMLVFKMGEVRWIEAKHKEAFSWYRKKGVFVTGIDLKHYADYCQVADLSQWLCMLMFLHRGGQAKDSPPSPSGLYGQDINILRKNESHRSDKWGNGGMVYWDIKTLVRYGDLS